MLLRNLGCRVDLAGSGHEALDAFRQTSYDLIFMDCQMPGMDGCEATRAIRKMEQADGTGPIPIVALTANALLGDREACLAVGMNDHLSKPFTKERLHAVVEQWLTHRGSQTGSASDQPLFPPFPDSASAGPTAPTPGIVDRGTWKIFEELDEPGQPDSLSHFMEIFLRDTTRKMSDLRVAVSTEDVATVAKIAHSLKSVSAVLGAMRLAALYKDMEANGLSSNLEPVQALLIQVEDEFQAVCDIFRNELTKRGVDTR